MKAALVGLIIGIVVGAGGMWFYYSTNMSVLEVNHKSELADERNRLDEKNSQLNDYMKMHEKYKSDTEKEKAKFLKDLSDKENILAKLREQNSRLASGDRQVAELEGQVNGLLATLAKYREAFPDFDPESASKEEIEDEKAMRDIMERMQRLTAIGGPLNDKAVKELELDENQVAGINQALKEEGERMHKRLAEWAAGFLDKSYSDLLKMSDLEISTSIMPHISEELALLRKLSPEDQRAVQFGDKHFVTFLPEDSKMRKIVEAFYDERKKTYELFPRYLSEDKEKILKEKYLQSGTFVFPGGAGYGMGQLTDEDFGK